MWSLAWGRRALVALLFLISLASLPAAQEGGGDASEPGPEEVQDPASNARLAPEEIEQVVEEASRAEATQIASEDAATGERLRSIFAALGELEGVRIEVHAGIVVLSGATSTREKADRAAEMARALTGVALVIDDITVQKSIGLRLASSWERVKAGLRIAIGDLPLFGAALAIIGLTWLLARLLRDATFLYRLMSGRLLLQNLLRQTVFVAVSLGGVILALRFLDAGALIGTALGAAGVVGLALGFAFRNIVENYLAGILLAIRQPFRLRDDVKIDGAVGTVLRMTSSETTLLDAEGNHLRLPNAMVFNGKLVNYTRNPLRRFTVSVGVGTDVDLGRAEEVGVATLRRMKGIAEDPAPSARVTALGDSTVQLDLYAWVDQRNINYFKAASEAHRLVKAAYDQAGIAMPAPAYLVQFDAPLAASGLPVGGATAAPRPIPADSGASPERLDLSPDDDLTKQVEAEIERSAEENLLAGPEEAT